MSKKLFSFFLLMLSFVVSAQKTESPNVVIIFVDDMGYGDLSSYGHPTIRTPKLDKMAEEGMRFTQFYVPAAVCTPSRAGLLTGRYPVRTGLVHGIMRADVLFPNDDNGLQPQEVTIAEVLKEKNYATIAIGKWHLGHSPKYLPTAQGFDEYYGIPYSNDMDYVPAKDGKSGFWNVPLMHNEDIIERPADQTTLTKRYTEKAINFIKSNKENPFFLYLAHSMPHIPLFTSPEFRGKSKRGLYGDVVEELDWSVGEIINTLKELNLEDNTLVVFTSDNGPWLVQKENGGSAGLLKDGKGTTWEGGHRVPMIAWWPGQVPKKIVNESIASTLDLLPTIAEVTKTSLPKKIIDGQNILSLLKNEKEINHEPFIFYRGNKVFAIREGKWKAHFITQTAYPNGPLVYHNPPLLYNLDVDPSEKYDLASQYPEVITNIKMIKERHEKTIKTFDKPTIEAENLIEAAKITGKGNLKVQKMPIKENKWGGDQQLWWVNAEPGNTLELNLDSQKSGEFELLGFFTRAKDYGIFQVSINGKPIGDLIDGYSESIEYSGPISFGLVNLKKGKNKMEIRLIGKDSRSGGFSDGYLVGIDGFLIKY